jgi:hypothetical protein
MNGITPYNRTIEVSGCRVRLKKIQVRCQGICQLIDQADEAGLVVELNELGRTTRPHRRP